MKIVMGEQEYAQLNDGQGAGMVATVVDGFDHFQQRVTLVAQRVTLVQNFADPTHIVKIDVQLMIWTA